MSNVSIWSLLFLNGVVAIAAADTPAWCVSDAHGYNCEGNTIKTVEGISQHIDCCSACTDYGATCRAWTWHYPTKECMLKSACTNVTSSSDYHTSWPRPGPTPPPSPPSPPSPPPSPLPPSPENPLGITPKAKRSDNFFLIIGDWGAPTDASWAHSTGGCQRQVAQMMKNYVEKYEKQGKKCLFVGAVGDNFYAAGVKDDSHWAKQWGNVYGTNDPDSALFGIPWLAVMGNHDLGGDDKECACGGVCKQFNNGGRPAGTEKFWMPDYYWHYYIGGSAKLEIVGLDTNAVDVGGLGGNGCRGGAKAACDYCGGQSKIQKFLDQKLNDGERYMDTRAGMTKATTAVILQHYDYGDKKGMGNVGSYLKKRFESQNHGKTHVLSAYGHAHDQVCKGDRTRGCDVILTGGGGGWKGGSYFGFTAVHLTDDGGFQTVLETNEVRIPQKSCSYLTDDYVVNNTLHAGAAIV